MKRLTLDKRAQQIQAKLQAGVRIPSAEAMANTGRRRTPSKRALLEALQRRAQETGRPAVFTAKF